MRRIIYYAICAALMAAFFAGLRFIVYDTSGRFGVGFGLGLGVGVLIAGLGAHIEYKERLSALERDHARRH